MTYRCPIDGRELADGKACPDHGIAYGSAGLGDDVERPTVARVTPLSRSSRGDAKAPRKSTRK